MQYTAKALAALTAVAGVANALPLTGKNTQIAKRDFNAKGSNNVAAWWGNSDKTNSAGLDKICAADYDIVILTFGISISGNTVNVAGGAEPKSLGDTIKKCQSSGKKVMMSLGGATGSITFASDDAASKAADTVADTFLKAGSGSYYGVPLDGIDIDNEDNNSQHWQKFVQQLRTHMSGSQYISGAPQCPFPDHNIDQATLNEMDFVWVQFYNNGPCNHGASGFSDSVKQWSKALTKPKLYIATPGDQKSASTGYIDAGAMAKEVAEVKGMNLPNFGGYAIWDGSTAILNSNYQSVIKKALGGSSSSGPSSGGNDGPSSAPASGPSTGADKPTGTGKATSTPKPTSAKQGKGQQTSAPAGGAGGAGATTVQATSTARVTSTQFIPSGTGAPAPTGSAGSTPSTGNTQTCSEPSKIICSADGKQFGICDGTNAVMSNVSEGTTCSNGTIIAIDSGSSDVAAPGTPASSAAAAAPSSTASAADASTSGGDDDTTGGDDASDAGDDQ